MSSRACSLPLACLLVGLGACHPGGAFDGISDLEAELSTSVSEVVELSWETDAPGVSWVEFGLDEQRLRSTPIIDVPSGQHSARLLGLPPLATVYFEVFTDTGEALHSEQGQLETGGLPPGMPDLDVLIHDEAAVSGEPFMMMTLIGAESFVVIVDRLGQVLWCRPMPHELERMVPTDVAWNRMGTGIVVGRFFMDLLTLASEASPSPSEAMFLDMSGGEIEVLDLGVAHHELVQLPDGRVATIGTDVRSWEDPKLGEEVQVMGDTVVLVSPGGEREEIFSTWDWAEPEVHERFYQISDEHGDWTHGNGLVYDEPTDTFLLSLGLVDTVLEISASTGEVLREFGPRGWAVEEGQAFCFQHDPHWTEDGTLLMASWVGMESRVMGVEYEVNEDKQALHQIWSYGEDEGFSSIAGGQAIRMSNGNTVINTGYRGLLVEVTPNGEPVWELATSMGHVASSVVFFDDFYKP